MPYGQIPEKPLTDEDKMPSGKHKGERMIDVPADHLWFIYDNDLCSARVRKYIEDNLDAIKSQRTKKD